MISANALTIWQTLLIHYWVGMHAEGKMIRGFFLEDVSIISLEVTVEWDEMLQKHRSWELWKIDYQVQN